MARPGLGPGTVAALWAHSDIARGTRAAVRRAGVRGPESVPGRTIETQPVQARRKLPQDGALGAAVGHACSPRATVLRRPGSGYSRLRRIHSGELRAVVVPAPVPVWHR